MENSGIKCPVCGHDVEVRVSEASGRVFCDCSNVVCPTHTWVTFANSEELARALRPSVRSAEVVRRRDPITKAKYDACGHCGKPLAKSWQVLPNYCPQCGYKVVE